MSAFGSDKHGSVAFVDRSPSLLERCEGSKGENSIAFATRVSGDANADLLSPSGASGERGGSNHDIPNYKHGSVAVADRSPSPLERCEGSKGETPLLLLQGCLGKPKPTCSAPLGRVVSAAGVSTAFLITSMGR